MPGNYIQRLMRTLDKLTGDSAVLIIFQSVHTFQLLVM